MELMGELMDHIRIAEILHPKMNLIFHDFSVLMGGQVKKILHDGIEILLITEARGFDNLFHRHVRIFKEAMAFSSRILWRYS